MTDTEKEILDMAGKCRAMKRDTETAAEVTALIFGAKTPGRAVTGNRKKNFMRAAALLIAEIREMES